MVPTIAPRSTLATLAGTDGRYLVIERRLIVGHRAPIVPLEAMGQTVDSLIGAVRHFEANARCFEPKALRARAEAFDRPRLKAEISASVARQREEFGSVSR